VYLLETEGGYASADGAAMAEGGFVSASAAVVGPGLGDVESVRQLLGALLQGKPWLDTPCVIDADALNALASTYGWWERLRVPGVLTPHPGEMGRLLARTTGSVQEDRVGTASAAAERWGQVIVLKGAHTVVAAPDGRTSVSPFANAALATAGTGDVLAGTIGALLAQGLDRYDAAVLGVHVHGAAGERASVETGPSGLLASDMLSEIPRAMQALRAL
jgi:hydroxyethylthiazole kinase-like uncharacterized protein yjeF